MMRKLICLTAAMVSLATTAVAQNGTTARGRLLVQRYCASCHAISRTGESPNPAAPAFRDLNRRYQIGQLGEALAEGILTGHPAMPEFKFEPRDVTAILTYLKSIQTLQAASAPVS